jgi:hypothetical protein
MQPWPEWWAYEVVISSHLVDRMLDRDFTETDVRTMLEDATGFHASSVPGRFCIESPFGSEQWEVVVEPDERDRALVVVSAYRVQ